MKFYYLEEINENGKIFTQCRQFDQLQENKEPCYPQIDGQSGNQFADGTINNFAQFATNNLEIITTLAIATAGSFLLGALKR